MTTKTFFIALALILIYLINLQIGRNDVFTLIFLIIVVLVTRSVILEFQMGGRQLLAEHFGDNVIKARITRPGFFSHIFSIIGAAVIALGFFTLLKGTVISHGLTISFILILIATFKIFPRLGENVKEGRNHQSGQGGGGITSVLKPTPKRFGDFVAPLLVAIIALNIFLALVLSAHDTHRFLTSEASFQNFDLIASESAIIYNGQNEYTRAILNAYILADTFRLALANSILSIFVPNMVGSGFFFFVYGITLIFNLVTLVPFSVGLVILLRGVRRHSDSAQSLTTKVKSRVQPQIAKYTPLVKSYFKRLMEEARKFKEKKLNKNLSPESPKKVQP